MRLLAMPALRGKLDKDLGIGAGFKRNVLNCYGAALIPTLLREGEGW